MIRRLRLVLVMTRPAVALLFALYAAIGLAATGHGEDRLLLARVLVVVFGFLLFSVACNDIADERVDAVNLAGDRRRPLVVGSGNRVEMLVIGGTSAVLALVFAATLGLYVLLVLVGGLILSAGYSVRPVRIADRGALASLVLPACYVAVPFLVGQFAAATRSVRPADLTLLAGGLYVTFIGRILLKDFRDVRGDALFGKRTFLVRHGRGWTCVFSAVCLTAGAAVLAVSVPHPTVALVTGYAGGTVALLGLLAVLRTDRGPRRDEAVISALAIVGRGMLLLLLAHLEMVTMRTGWPEYNGLMAGLVVLFAGQAIVMFRRGPITRTTVSSGGQVPTNVYEEAV
ncbi:MAG TPA: UbiA family prenyltransferase [Pseudonocardiaceae bacterium]|jgi:4-hydroxybenzoate polyprenyltransferase|nr:UbiA family prenyltransferase [Pseudonocardiaceae bacterium]